ncbi:MAG: glycosyltransferase [Candidatus Binatia bacterium]
MPTLTVSMPAYNVGPYIRQAVESVLCQEGVDVELIVVDDGSTDQTAEVVASCRDARVRLLRNGRRMGISYCHNVILRESRSPFIAHVDADDFLLPGALRKMVETLESDPGVGQAHCYFFDVDEYGKTTREAFRERWTSFRRNRPPTLNYQAELMRGSNVINSLRTYRRAVLEELGGFNEKVRFGEDYGMALRVLDRYTIKLVPEFLYCRRVHGTNTTESLRWKTVRFWVQTYWIRRQLVRERKVRFLTGVQFDLHRRMYTWMRDACGRVIGRRRVPLRRHAAFLKWRVVAPVAATLYRAVVQHLSWWPLGWFGGQSRRRVAGERRIAYYLHGFPVLSETFIQREVAALRRAGLAVEVVAHGAQDVEYLGDDVQALMQQTHYLTPLDRQKLARYILGFSRWRPLTLMNVFLHVVCCRYDAQKSFGRDVYVFRHAVYLAGVLHEKGVNHVHAPWASLDAFVALLAARLLQIPYTVQARAYDLHRHSSACGLPTRLAHAEWVMTNAEYNASVIKSLLPPESASKVHTIYEGIDLERFRPGNGKRESDSVVRVLSVARLVEPKGLEYLIGACKILKDGGHTVRCEIIGGRVATEANYYIRLQKLRQTLALEQEVRFLGTQPFARVLEKYAEADLFVLPSVIAGDGSGDVTPNVVIEAMAMKLPVVSTKSRGIPELVEDGVSGLLVPPRDKEALVQAILRLMEDEKLRVTLGNNARKKVEERFDISKNINAFVALFQRGA